MSEDRYGFGYILIKEDGDGWGLYRWPRCSEDKIPAGYHKVYKVRYRDDHNPIFTADAYDADGILSPQFWAKPRLGIDVPIKKGNNYEQRF